MSEREAVRTAPERIWLQISDDSDHMDEAFPVGVNAEITWCQDSVMAAEVEYVRADLYSTALRERDEWRMKADLFGDAIMACRDAAKTVTGGNCDFVDDDVAKTMLALRAEAHAARAVAIEECAAMLDAKAHAYAAKWSAHGDNDSITHGYATAWDYAQCACDVRSLARKA